MMPSHLYRYYDDASSRAWVRRHKKVMWFALNLKFYQNEDKYNFATAKYKK